MDEERGKFQFAGLKFIYDLELVDDPVLINNLKMNILDVSTWIQDVELLSSYNHRCMLVYVKMGWIGRKFFHKTIEDGVLDRVKQLLPRFKFRVVTDRKIMDLALEKVKYALGGTTNENTVDNGVRASDSKSDTGTRGNVDSGVSSTESKLQKEPNVLQDHKVKT
jgi:hypothetical protein